MSTLQPFELKLLEISKTLKKQEKNELVISDVHSSVISDEDLQSILLLLKNESAANKNCNGILVTQIT